MKTIFVVLIVVFGLLLAGCGQPAATPSFTASPNLTSLSIQQGQSGNLVLTLTPQDGFSGSVALSLVGAPAGVDLTPANVTLTGAASVTHNITIRTATTTPAGSHNIQVRAASGGITREMPLTLVVTLPPNFTTSLNPASLSIQQGQSGSTTLTLIPQNNFSGTVTLRLVGAPTGVSLSPTSVILTGTAPVNQTITIWGTNNVPTGNHNEVDPSVKTEFGPGLSDTPPLPLVLHEAWFGRSG